MLYERACVCVCVFLRVCVSSVVNRFHLVSFIQSVLFACSRHISRVRAQPNVFVLHRVNKKNFEYIYIVALFEVLCVCGTTYYK